MAYRINANLGGAGGAAQGKFRDSSYPNPLSPLQAGPTNATGPTGTGAQPWQPPGGFGAGSWGSFSRGKSGGRGDGEGGGDLDIPDYDQDRVESLAQRVAAPGIRKLRNEVQTVQGGVYDNPNVKSMTLRQALEGYGQGLENIMGGAFQTASGIYNQEYSPQVREAEINYQGNLQREMQQNSINAQKEIARYNRTWEAWLRNNR